MPDPSQRTAEDLLQVIKEELGEDPPVLVQPRVKQGRPAKVLIEESADADLLVVGTRGHGGFRGWCSARSASTSPPTRSAR